MSRKSDSSGTLLGTYKYQIDAVLRRWPVIVGAMLLAVAVVYLGTRSQAATYEATATVVDPTSAAEAAIEGVVNPTVTERHLNNEAQIARSDEMVAEVEELIGLSLSDSTVAVAEDTDAILFTGVAGSPGDAARIANEWATVFALSRSGEVTSSISESITAKSAELNELILERDASSARLEDMQDELAATTDPDTRSTMILAIDREARDVSNRNGVLDEEIRTLTADLGELEKAEQFNGEGAFVVSARAETPGLVQSSSRILLPLALVAGAMIGFLLALVLAAGDRRVRGEHDIIGAGLDFLGSVPAGDTTTVDVALAAQAEPQTEIAAAYQQIRVAVQASLGPFVPGRSIAVASVGSGEGRTTAAVNLGSAFSSIGWGTAVFDADYEHPDLHRLFSVPQQPGLADVVLNGAEIGDVSYTWTDWDGPFAIVPAGTTPRQAERLLGGTDLEGSLKGWLTGLDLAVFDVSPLAVGASALEVAAMVDGVVLTAEAGKTSADALLVAQRSIERAGGKVLGVITTETGGSKTGVVAAATSTLFRNNAPLVNS